MINPLFFGAGVFQTLYLVFATAGVGIPVSMPPGEADPFLARIAPEECLYYTNWSGVGDAKVDSDNTVDQFYRDPEIKHFLERLPEGIQQIIEIANMEAAPNGEDIVSFHLGFAATQVLATRPATMFITDFSPDLASASGAIVINVEEGQQVLTKHIEAFVAASDFDSVEEISIHGSPFSRIQISESLSFTWGVHDNYLMAAVGKGVIEEIIDRSATPAPNWLVDIQEQYKLPRRATLTYANLRELIAITTESTDDQQVIDASRASGFQHLDSFVCVTGLDEQQYVSRTYIKIDEDSDGLLTVLPSQPLEATNLESIPTDAMFAVAFKMEVTQAFDALLAFAGQLDAGMAKSFEEFSEGFEEMVGSDFRQDLLAALGEEFTLYTTKADGGLMTGWTMTVEVTDSKKLTQISDKIIGLVQSEEASINTHDFEGKQVSTLRSPALPFAPTWCLNNSQLVFGLFPQSVRSHVQSDTTKGSLTNRDDIQRLFAGNSNPCLLVYRDTRGIMEEVYPTLQMGVQMALSFMPPEMVSMDISMLPSARAITRNMQPAIWLARRDSNGFEFESFQSLPGGSFSASAPIAIAAAIPAIDASARASRRAASVNNLRQIMLAVHNYSATHNKLPAAYNTDEDGKPLLSWRVHLLPYLDEFELYNQFRLDEPWDSPHNRQLIAQIPDVYRSPSSDADPGKTNYLALRGEHGVIVPPEESEHGKENPLGIEFGEILDGTSNTIAIVEASNESAVIWTKPDDLIPNLANPIQGLMGVHQGLFIVAITDGSVRTLPAETPPDTLRGLFTRDQAEVVDGF